MLLTLLGTVHHAHTATFTYKLEALDVLDHDMAYTLYVCHHTLAHVILNDVHVAVHNTVAHSLIWYVAHAVAEAVHVNVSDVPQLYDVVRLVTGDTVVVPHHQPVDATHEKFSQSVTTRLYVHAVHGIPSKSAKHLFLLLAIFD